MRALGLMIVAAAMTGCAAIRALEYPAGRAAGSADSLVFARWDLDDPAPFHSVLDSGPLGLHGLAATSAGSRRGFSGLCRQFDGTGFVLVPFDARMNELEALTIEAYVKVTEESGTIAARWGDVHRRSWWFGFGQEPASTARIAAVRTARRLVFICYSEPERAPYSYVSDIGLTPEVWHRVTVHYDGRVVRFSVDGRDDRPQVAHGPISPSEAHLTLGGYSEKIIRSYADEWQALTANGLELVGSLDEVRIARRRASN